MTAPTIRLLVRADDAGCFSASNRAVLDCCNQGIVRNVSIMAPAGCFDEAAEMLRGRDDICVGIHGTITCEWNEVRWRPVAPRDKIRSLLDADGYLHHDFKPIMQAGVKFSEIITELQAQLDKVRAAGLKVHYADNHMMFGWLFEGSNDTYRLSHALAAWAREEGIVWHGWGDDLGLSWVDIGEGPREELPARFAQALRTIGPGNYAMVAHPSYPDGDIATKTYGTEAPGKVAAERNIERRLFMEPAVVNVIAERGINLIRYPDLNK